MKNIQFLSNEADIQAILLHKWVIFTKSNWIDIMFFKKNIRPFCRPVTFFSSVSISTFQNVYTDHSTSFDVSRKLSNICSIRFYRRLKKQVDIIEKNRIKFISKKINKAVFSGPSDRWRSHELLLMKKRIFPCLHIIHKQE